MTELELIQENEKLNQRLSKAIEVFKEQKENIVRLTEERDEAKNALSTKEATIEELRNKLDEKSENDEKFFEQVNEIQQLKRSVQELQNTIEESTNTLAQKDYEIKRLESEATGFQMQVDTANKLLADNEVLNNQKLKALNDIIEETKAANEELNNELNETKEALEKSQNMLADTQAKMDAEISNLMQMIDGQNQTINMLSTQNENAKAQVSQVKTKIQEINRLGSDLMNNFNMFE